MNSGLTELQTSILMTLVHADLYGQPLTLDELQAGLFSPREVGFSELADALQHDPLLNALVRRKSGYYFLEGRQSLLDVRRHRELLTELHTARAALFLAACCGLPLVESVFLCFPGSPGTLADARINLFLVARPGFGWTASWLVWVLRHLMGLGRLVAVQQVTEAGRLDVAERDIFTAHRLATLRPIGNAASAPLKAANPWARDFFANAYAHAEAVGGPGREPWTWILAAGFWSPVERILEGLLDGTSVRPRPAESVRRVADLFDRAWSVWHSKAREMREFLIAGTAR